MRAKLRLILSSAMVLLLNAPLAEAQKPSPAEQILRNSDWSFVLQGGQGGGIRIRNGTIYPGNTSLNNAVGEAAFVGPDRLNLRFYNHPKISNGEATVIKIGAGQWAGPLVQPGLERRIVLKRER